MKFAIIIIPVVVVIIIVQDNANTFLWVSDVYLYAYMRGPRRLLQMRCAAKQKAAIVPLLVNKCLWSLLYVAMNRTLARLSAFGKRPDIYLLNVPIIDAIVRSMLKYFWLIVLFCRLCWNFYCYPHVHSTIWSTCRVEFFLYSSNFMHDKNLLRLHQSYLSKIIFSKIVIETNK